VLKHIHILNFAIADDIEITLDRGMTVLTGETGAGKSIIIDAIELALGQRVTGDVVRAGKARAEISVEFDIAAYPELLAQLAQLDLEDGESCLIRRTLTKEGRSKCFLNGSPVTLQTVKVIASKLMNIHGQHEFQSLLKPDLQRQLLDQFGQHETLAAKLNQIYQDWSKATGEFKKLSAQNQESTSRAAFLQFQLEEFEALNLTQASLTNLQTEQKQLAQAENLIADGQLATNLLSDAEASVMTQLNQITQALGALTKVNEALSPVAKTIKNVSIELEEASHELHHFVDRLELNPARLQEVDNQLTRIYDLARKHHVDMKALVSHFEKLQNEYDALQCSDETLAALLKQIDTLKISYEKVAKKLSLARQKTAKQLSTLITKNMQRLNMSGGQFEVALAPLESSDPTPYGLEKVLLNVSANPGQPLKALNQVASGGELSRISLAVQVITASRCQTPTLVFDEVDVGIGGATADIVGDLLAELSIHAQVICITHLAQVAAKADHHWLVEKVVKAGQTRSGLKSLDTETRILEIARMTGGVDISKATLAHAKSLLKPKKTTKSN
jgi:DNA repair protein RecN (Recombination protein N)